MAAERKLSRIWTNRAPRFPLDSESQTLIFTKPKGKDISLTKVIDVSSGGVSFMTRASDVPEMGETISVNVAVFGFPPVIRKAKVVRVEKRDDSQELSMFVAVQFVPEKNEFKNPRRQKPQTHFPVDMITLFLVFVAVLATILYLS